MRKVNKGFSLVILASILYASVAIAGKGAINTGINVYTLIILQYSLMVVILLAYYLPKGINTIKLSKNEMKSTILQGIFGSTGFIILFYLSLETLNAGIASMLIFTSPVYVNLFFIVTKIKKISKMNVVAMLMAFIGSILVLNILGNEVLHTTTVGIFYGLLCGICYAFYNVNADLKLRNIDPGVITLYTSIIVLIIASIINPGFYSFNFVVTKDICIFVFILAVVSGIIPNILLYKGISLIGSEYASIIATAELPVTLIMAYFLLAETINILQFVGVILVISSIILLQRIDKD